jgi:hypothetical protein
MIGYILVYWRPAYAFNIWLGLHAKYEKSLETVARTMPSELLDVRQGVLGLS